MASTDLHLRIPGKYAAKAKADTTGAAAAPSLEWLQREWTVTHSTLKRWRTAQNLSITYGQLPATSSGAARVSDTVAYQAKGKPKVKTISGIDTAAGSTLVWDWRGTGMLKPISCRWEVIAWGERTLSTDDGAGSERLVVTWFAPTLFTEEGIDIYSDRKEGMSQELAGIIKAGLAGLEAEALATLIKDNLMEVHINLDDLPGNGNS